MRWKEWQAIYMYDWVEKDWLGLCQVDKEEKSFQAEWIASTRQEDVKWQHVLGNLKADGDGRREWKVARDDVGK